jgi:hypothetical protein
MLKIAVCFYGHLGGNIFKNQIGGVIPISESFKSLNEKIIKSNKECEFDFFVHSWSVEQEKEILQSINPVEYKIEPQINFDKEANSNYRIYFDFKDFRSTVSLFLRKIFLRKNYDKIINKRKKTRFGVYSRRYSSREAIKLKHLYETKNNFKYDYVFLTRFDVFWHKTLRFKDLKNNYFYSSNWNVPTFFGLINKNFDNRNFQDYWFVSNSKMMDVFSTIYEKLENYYFCSHRASYQHAKKMFGQENLRYIMKLVDDYELYRRVKKTEKNQY